jgi:hypothetical protein
MLREVGKRDQQAKEELFKKHGRIMLHTMLKYAVECFAERKRPLYLMFLLHQRAIPAIMYCDGSQHSTTTSGSQITALIQ